MTDIFSPEKRSDIMSRIRSSGSKMEIAMKQGLREAGILFEEQPKDVIGKPDFVIRVQKIAIFCDSEYWHGYDWKNAKENIKSRKEFWINKIEGNIKRDRKVNRMLRKEGWTVLRFWEREIYKNLNECLSRIINMFS